MKRLLFLLVVLGLSVWIGLLIYADPGYVLFAYQGWTIEMTLWFAVLVLIVTFIVFYIVFRVLGGVSHLSARLQHWSGHRRMKHAHNLTVKGFCALAEGHWKRGESDLVRAAADCETPWMNYMGAAHAAQARKAYEARDRYLNLADACTDGTSLTVKLIQAQLQYRCGHYEQALATLMRLRHENPKHPQVLRLLQQTYLALCDWQHLRELLPELRKRKALTLAERYRLEQQVYTALFKDAAANGRQDDVEKVWKEVPAVVQQEQDVLLGYVDALVQQGCGDRAEVLLRQALRRAWNSECVSRYGVIDGGHPAKQLSTAEAWLKHHEQDPVLLLCVGRLCQRNRLWGRARTYLATAMAIQPTLEVYRELGQVFEQLGERKEAMEYYRRGVMA